MKKIFLNKRQLTEVIGADFDYLVNDGNGLNQYIGDAEIVTNPKLNNDKSQDALTTDKISKSIAPRYFYGHRDVRGLMSCNKEPKMNIVESNKDLENKTFKIPDELFSLLKRNYMQYNNINGNEKGIKRLNNLIQNRNITTNEMYRLKNYFDNENKNSEEYNIIGGDKLKNWVNKELNTATSISYRSKDVKRQMGDTNAFISPHEKEYNNDKAHSTTTQKLKNDTKITYE